MFQQMEIGRVKGEEGAVTGAPWERVRIAPPEDWVEEERYDVSLAPAKEGPYVTQLLVARQVEAEKGVTFFANAARLETALAVQNESQWRLDLGRHARVTLHWVRVVRDGVAHEQLKPERLRLLQRETQLERQVIDGSWTILLVLEDVRPGDVIESAYSCEAPHPIRPGACEVFFSVPATTRVGRYRLTVESAAARADLRWKASADAPPRREEMRGAGRQRWVWEGVQGEAREAEPNLPSSFLDCLWVQVSDLPDWRSLAARVAEVWSAQGGAHELARLPGFAKPRTVDGAAVLALVRRVQDDFRYLSLDLEASGWVPSAPEEVARRRHGDCKDLVWLAASALRAWGVSARPVLVATGLEDRVAELLPMAGLLNHAILEVEQGGERRWFDLTCRDLGGDFATQWVGWFGRGLVVDEAEGGLCAQPGRRIGCKVEARETFLLDTSRGGASLVELRVRSQGWRADELRRRWLAQGAAAFWLEREEMAKRRYGRALRVGEPCWRDDRNENVCDIVEMFELKDAVYADDSGRRAVFDVRPNLVVQTFLLPEDRPRRGPWAMPFPFEVAHEEVIKAPSLGVLPGARRTWAEAEFDAALECTRPRGVWTNRVRFRVGGPLIPAARVPEYRRRLEACFQALFWRVFLPWGVARSRRVEGLGALDAPGAELVSGPVLASEPGPAVDRAEGVEAAGRAPKPAKPPLVIRRSRASRTARASAEEPLGARKSKGASWVVPVVVLLGGALAFALTRGCTL